MSYTPSLTTPGESYLTVPSNIARSLLTNHNKSIKLFPKLLNSMSRRPSKSTSFESAPMKSEHNILSDFTVSATMIDCVSYRLEHKIYDGKIITEYFIGIPYNLIINTSDNILNVFRRECRRGEEEVERFRIPRKVADMLLEHVKTRESLVGYLKSQKVLGFDASTKLNNSYPMTSLARECRALMQEYVVKNYDNLPKVFDLVIVEGMKVLRHSNSTDMVVNNLRVIRNGHFEKGDENCQIINLLKNMQRHDELDEKNNEL